MALSDSRRKANDRYIQSHYKRLPVSYKTEFVEAVAAAAQAANMSLAGYVRAALVEKMGHPPSEEDASEEE